MTYKLTDNGVLDTIKNQIIPADEFNRHWQEYQSWLKEGNTPAPADIPEPVLPEKPIVILPDPKDIDNLDLTGLKEVVKLLVEKFT